jgi:hypothetical protein
MERGLILGEDLRMLENRVLKRIYPTKREEITRGRRKANNEQLHDLHSLSDVIRIINAKKMQWAGHVDRIGEKINSYELFIAKRKGKRQLGRLRRRCDNYITIYLKRSRMEWHGLDSSDSG